MSGLSASVYLSSRTLLLGLLIFCDWVICIFCIKPTQPILCSVFIYKP